MEEKVWEWVERVPTYSDDYMWDVANQFGSYGEYMEWLEHLQGTEDEKKRTEEFFQYHHLIEVKNA